MSIQKYWSDLVAYISQVRLLRAFHVFARVIAQHLSNSMAMGPLFSMSVLWVETPLDYPLLEHRTQKLRETVPA